MTRHFDVAIVGSGHGGAQAAIALRQKKFSGSIGIITADREPPYERPPLTKEYLSGDRPLDRMLIRPKPFWEGNGIDLLTSRRVIKVLADRKALKLSNDTCVSYDKLLWAAGGEARRLGCRGAELDGVCYIRALEDCDYLRSRLAEARKIVVIGGGYIGLEAAATLSKQGKHITVIEAGSRVLARACDPVISRFLEDKHREQGVCIRVGSQVASIDGQDGSVESVTLDNGERLEADLVIAGIGLAPEVEALADAGARCSNGVVVDQYCRTTLEDIYAIGDCAAFKNSFTHGERVRLESVQNATGMARAAVSDIIGECEPYAETPWFWSHQFDLKLQTVGLNADYDATVLRGDPKTDRFSLIYLREGAVIALDCINTPADFAQGRKLVTNQLRVDVDLLANTDEPLKTMAERSYANN